MRTLFELLYGMQAAAFEAGASERLMRWATAFDDWLVERPQGRAAWKEFLSFSHKLPWEQTPAELATWCNYLLQNQGQSPKTVRLKVFLIKNFYERAEQKAVDGEGSPNLFYWFRLPVSIQERRADTLDEAEVQALLGSIDRETSVIGKRDYAIMLALLMTGLFLEEVRCLQWKDLQGDWEKGQMWTARKKGFVGSRHDLQEELTRAIQAYLQASGRMETIQADDYIFASAANVLGRSSQQEARGWNPSHPLSTQAINLMVKTYAAWAGLKEELINPKMLRFTAINLRLARGDSLEEIQQFMGYQDSSYSRWLATRLANQPARSLWKETTGRQATAAGSQEKGGSAGAYQRVGRGQSPESHRVKHGLYANALAPADQSLIEQAEASDVQGEIIAMRLVMERILSLAMQSQDPKELSHLAEIFGETTARLTNLMKTDRELAGGQDGLDKALEAALRQTQAETGWDLGF